jgi:rod shape-determining protein MreD
MRLAFTVALTLALLWALVAQVNHVLTGVRVYLFVGSLFLTYAALKLRLHAGLGATLLGGLICDANAPVDFGTHTLLFAAAHAIVFNLRDGLPRDDTIARVIVALLTNLALFLVFSFIQIASSPAPAAAWPRLIVDLLCSQVFLALVAPWFFALQHRSLVLVRAERELAE